MKPLRILFLDVLFIGSSVGLLETGAAISLSMLRAASGQMSRYLLTGAATWLFWSAAAGSGVLALLMLLDAYRSRATTDWQLWWKVLLLNAIIVGPAAYYLTCVRPRLVGRPQQPALERARRSRVLLDVLAGVTLWTAVGVGVSFAALLALRPSHLTFVIAAAALVVAMTFGATSIVIFLTLMLVDAWYRSREQRLDADFLMMLNSWAWIFGLRKYYFQVVRPELKSPARKRV